VQHRTIFKFLTTTTTWI